MQLALRLTEVLFRAPGSDRRQDASLGWGSSRALLGEWLP